MSIFSQNIKLLRKREGISQDASSKKIGLTRSTLNGYENSFVQPPHNVLINISDYYKISVDTLLKKDLNTFSEQNLNKAQDSNSFDIYGNKLRTLVTNNSTNYKTNGELVSANNFIEYIIKYDDFNFISGLPLIKLPFLEESKHYRMFEFSSCAIVNNNKNLFVIGEYLLDWTKINDSELYIIVTELNGIEVKQVYTENMKSGFIAESVNVLQEPIFVKYSDVLEIWQVISYINTNLFDNNNDSNLEIAVKKLQRKVVAMETELKKLL
ncbi:MAG: helix-turn-helix transcriptional regulator [Ichthyobacteriaceae bacterium]|nr:helix-turn-helix transcriptional regulator [Ichthyobacteriaceae bacterium]